MTDMLITAAWGIPFFLAVTYAVVRLGERLAGDAPPPTAAARPSPAPPTLAE